MKHSLFNKRPYRVILVELLAISCISCKTGNIQSSSTKDGFDSVGGKKQDTRTEVHYEVGSPYIDVNAYHSGGSPHYNTENGFVPLTGIEFSENVGKIDKPGSLASFVPQGRVLCAQFLVRVNQVINILPSGEFPAPNPKKEEVLVLGSREGNDRSVCANIVAPIQEDLIFNFKNLQQRPIYDSGYVKGFKYGLSIANNGTSQQVGLMRSFLWDTTTGPSGYSENVNRQKLIFEQLCTKGCTVKIDNNNSPPRFFIEFAPTATGYGQTAPNPSRSRSSQTSASRGIDRRALDDKMEEVAGRNGNRIVDFGRNSEGEELLAWAQSNRLEWNAATYFVDWLRSAEAAGHVGRDISDIRVNILVTSAGSAAGSIDTRQMNEIYKTATDPSRKYILIGGPAWRILQQLQNDSRLSSSAQTELRDFLRKNGG